MTATALINIDVDDLERAVAFYTAALGLQVAPIAFGYLRVVSAVKASVGSRGCPRSITLGAIAIDLRWPYLSPSNRQVQLPRRDCFLVAGRSVRHLESKIV